MERRDFIRAGAGGLVGGWFATRMAVAEAAGKPQQGPLPALKEWDEHWLVDGVSHPIHVIDVTLPFDNPNLMFQVGESDRTRIVIPRNTAGEMHQYEGPMAGPLTPANLKSMLVKRLGKIIENYWAARNKPEGPLMLPMDRHPAGAKLHAVHLIARCPTRTDYGVAVAPHDCLRGNRMILTVPASILFDI